MKKLIALILALSVCLLCGCGGSDTPATTETAAEETGTATMAATVPESTAEDVTEAVTEAAVMYTNPLTGEAVDHPITTRPVAVSLNNIQGSLPHRGVADADIYFESFVNGTIVRGLAVYADITTVGSIGSVRSARPILIDICSHYNMFYAHTGGSDHTYTALKNFGISHMNVDSADDSGYSYRDRERNKSYDWEHCLFVRGAELMDYITTQKGVDMSMDTDTSFGLTFTEDGTPAGGETANTVTITLKYGGANKQTTMVYNESTGKYEYNQYGKTMQDADTGETEAFTNVVVMYTDMYNQEGYHYAKFTSGGNGYFACGGKIIPIQWKCAGEDQPFTYYTTDGEPLDFGVGSSYIAITVNNAPVSYQ